MSLSPAATIKACLRNLQKLLDCDDLGAARLLFSDINQDMLYLRQQEGWPKSLWKKLVCDMKVFEQLFTACGAVAHQGGRQPLDSPAAFAVVHMLDILLERLELDPAVNMMAVRRTHSSNTSSSNTSSVPSTVLCQASRSKLLQNLATLMAGAAAHLQRMAESAAAGAAGSDGAAAGKAFAAAMLVPQQHATAALRVACGMFVVQPMHESAGNSNAARRVDESAAHTCGCAHLLLAVMRSMSLAPRLSDQQQQELTADTAYSAYTAAVLEALRKGVMALNIGPQRVLLYAMCKPANSTTTSSASTDSGASSSARQPAAAEQFNDTMWQCQGLRQLLLSQATLPSVLACILAVSSWAGVTGVTASDIAAVNTQGDGVVVDEAAMKAALLSQGSSTRVSDVLDSYHQAALSLLDVDERPIAAVAAGANSVYRVCETLSTLLAVLDMWFVFRARVASPAELRQIPAAQHQEEVDLLAMVPRLLLSWAVRHPRHSTRLQQYWGGVNGCTLYFERWTEIAGASAGASSSSSTGSSAAEIAGASAGASSSGSTGSSAAEIAGASAGASSSSSTGSSAAASASATTPSLQYQLQFAAILEGVLPLLIKLHTQLHKAAPQVLSSPGPDTSAVCNAAVKLCRLLRVLVSKAAAWERDAGAATANSSSVQDPSSASTGAAGQPHASATAAATPAMAVLQQSAGKVCGVLEGCLRLAAAFLSCPFPAGFDATRMARMVCDVCFLSHSCSKECMWSIPLVMLAGSSSGVPHHRCIYSLLSTLLKLNAVSGIPQCTTQHTADSAQLGDPGALSCVCMFTAVKLIQMDACKLTSNSTTASGVSTTASGVSTSSSSSGGATSTTSSSCAATHRSVAAEAGGDGPRSVLGCNLLASLVLLGRAFLRLAGPQSQQQDPVASLPQPWDAGGAEGAASAAAGPAGDADIHPVQEVHVDPLTLVLFCLQPSVDVVNGNQPGQSTLHLLTQPVLTWLRCEPIAAQLASAGYDVGSLVESLEQLLAACDAVMCDAVAPLASGSAATIDLTSGSPVMAGFMSELRATGSRLAALPVPDVCNNPSCLNLSGPSDSSLVSGRNSRCSGCLKVRYCSKACQRVHWHQHKPVCKALAAAAAAAGEADGGGGGDA